MSLTFGTANPQALLSAFKKGIDDKRIVTWSYDQDGDFSHTPDQWRGKAWLRPEIQPNQLYLYVLKPKVLAVSSEVYAVYHGRFIEAMLAHCETLFSYGSAGALASNRDMVSN